MSPRDYLRDMLVYLQDIAAFTTNGREEFMMDRKTQLAVIISQLPDDGSEQR